MSARHSLSFPGLFSKNGCLLRFFSITTLLSFLLLVPDVPSAPSAITLLVCTGSEMVLGWRAPAYNGGDPVRGYYLEQREEGMKLWREVNVKAVKERQFKVSVAPA